MACFKRSNCYILCSMIMKRTRTMQYQQWLQLKSNKSLLVSRYIHLAIDSCVQVFNWIFNFCIQNAVNFEGFKISNKGSNTASNSYMCVASQKRIKEQLTEARVHTQMSYLPNITKCRSLQNTEGKHKLLNPKLSQNMTF